MLWGTKWIFAILRNDDRPSLIMSWRLLTSVSQHSALLISVKPFVLSWRFLPSVSQHSDLSDICQPIVLRVSLDVGHGRLHVVVKIVGAQHSFFKLSFSLLEGIWILSCEFKRKYIVKYFFKDFECRKSWMMTFLLPVSVRMCQFFCATWYVKVPLGSSEMKFNLDLIGTGNLWCQEVRKCYHRVILCTDALPHCCAWISLLHMISHL